MYYNFFAGHTLCPFHNFLHTLWPFHNFLHTLYPFHNSVLGSDGVGVEVYMINVHYYYIFNPVQTVPLLVVRFQTCFLIMAVKVSSNAFLIVLHVSITLLALFSSVSWCSVGNKPVFFLFQVMMSTTCLHQLCL